LVFSGPQVLSDKAGLAVSFGADDLAEFIGAPRARLRSIQVAGARTAARSALFGRSKMRCQSCAGRTKRVKRRRV